MLISKDNSGFTPSVPHVGCLNSPLVIILLKNRFLYGSKPTRGNPYLKEFRTEGANGEPEEGPFPSNLKPPSCAHGSLFPPCLLLATGKRGAEPG